MPVARLRYLGQAYELEVPLAPDYRRRFDAAHARLFGHADAGATGRGRCAPSHAHRRRGPSAAPRAPAAAPAGAAPVGARIVWNGRRVRVARYQRDDAAPRDETARPGASPRVQRDDARTARLARCGRRGLELAARTMRRRADRSDRSRGAASPPGRDRRGDGRAPRTHRLLAQHQGAARLLVRGLRPRGSLVAQAAHIPVHLGSTPLSVRAALDACRPGPGDVVVLNDPYAGGTHLPDVTVVAPVHDARRRLLGFVANRAHHADIGGMTPGLDAARARDLPGRIPPAAGAARARRDGRRATCSRSSSPTRAYRPSARATSMRNVPRSTSARVVCASVAGEMAPARSFARHGDAAGLLGASHGGDAARAAAPARTAPTDVLDDDGITLRPVPIRVAVTIGNGRARRRLHRHGAASARAA